MLVFINDLKVSPFIVTTLLVFRMASNIKKAGSAIRNSFRAKKYAIFDTKENNYILSPDGQEESPKKMPRLQSFPVATSDKVLRSNSVVGDRHGLGKTKTASSSSSEEGDENVSTLANVGSDSGTPVPLSRKTSLAQTHLKRRSKVSQSMRVAVGNLRQKLKITRQASLQITPKQEGRGRRLTDNVRLYSPFKIDTPPGAGHQRKNCTSFETPTRLRREVEYLTANMQALSSLTPNTLQSRSRTRKSPSSAATSGNGRTPRSTRKRITLV